MVDLKELPADVEKLKAIISFQIKNHKIEIQDFKTRIQDKDTELAGLNYRIEILEEALLLARRQKFASTSEKLPSNQILLFNEAELLLKTGEPLEEEQPGLSVPAHTRNRPVRKPLPDHLPREEVIIDLSDEEKICDRDGTVLKEIGADVSEQLDIIPMQMKVIRTIRKKYACPCCEDTIKTAKLPEKILPKSNATPGLLAHIAVSKYVDALPLYRLEQIFKRDDIDIPRNTMAGWMIDLSDKLIPVYNLMEEDLLSSDYVCCDETRVQVLKEPGKSAQDLSYMWVRARHGPNTNPIILFDYDPTRSKEVPNRLLKDFKGYLQADGYGGYDEVCKSADIIRVGCMAHLRRKFFDAHKVSPKQGDAYVLETIKKLYKIEDAIKDKTMKERLTRISHT